jgi:hypothetical protein
MAIYIAGISSCPLCGQLVNPNESAINFPPFFLNQHHQVFEITDSVVHRSCLAKRPYANTALAKLAKYEARRGKPHMCTICNQDISDSDDFFGTGPLADDPTEAVAHLDWFEAHVSCLRTWSGRAHLIDELLEASNSPDWEGDVLVNTALRLQELGATPTDTSVHRHP